MRQVIFTQNGKVAIVILISLLDDEKGWAGGPGSRAEGGDLRVASSSPGPAQRPFPLMPARLSPAWPGDRQGGRGPAPEISPARPRSQSRLPCRNGLPVLTPGPGGGGVPSTPPPSRPARCSLRAREGLGPSFPPRRPESPLQNGEAAGAHPVWGKGPF